MTAVKAIIIVTEKQGSRYLDASAGVELTARHLARIRLGQGFYEEAVAEELRRCLLSPSDPVQLTVWTWLYTRGLNAEYEGLRLVPVEQLVAGPILQEV